MVKVKNIASITRSSSVVLLSQELFFVLFVLAIVLIFQPTRADAATFNVATGSSSTNDGDSICQLDEAISNINDGGRYYEDCVETGVYGTDDTINLPAGTITMSGSGLEELYQSAKIIGDPSGTSVISDRGLELSGSGVAFTLQNFTMTGKGIGAEGLLDQLTIDRVEVDLQDNNGIALNVEGFHNLEVRDSYFHNAGGTSSDSGVGLMIFSAPNYWEDGATTVNIERTTISHVVGPAILMQHMAGSGYYGDFGLGSNVLNATIKNTTITDIVGIGVGSGQEIITSGAGVLAMAATGTVNYTTINNTYSNISNSDVGGYSAGAIREVGLGDGHIHHTAQNDLYAVGNGSGSVNYQREIFQDEEFSGTPTFTATSLGGNLSSDGSLSAWLTQPTDKHNVTSLASFLGALSDNGGSVPTLALLEGSPAINAGTPVAGLTTDARGAARVQQGAIDTGAYESAFTVASTSGSQDNLASTGQNTRLAAFTASLLALGGATLSQVRKLKSRAKFISLR